MKIKLFPACAVIGAALLFPSLTVPIHAGTISVVNLPPTSTDIATGITTNKTYVSAFNFGSQNTTVYSVNGVPFAHFRSASQNIYLSTNWVDTVHGGQVIVSTAVTNKGIDVTSSGSQGNLTAQADGNMRSLLTDLMYPGNGAPVTGWLQQEYDNLTIGHQYSLRVYYRYWGNAVGDRTQDFLFNGEGTWQAYSGNPVDEDAGTNGVLPNGLVCHGARFIEYDFTADATNVYCIASNLIGNGAAMIYAATLEDDSQPYAPFITYQTSAAGVGNGIYRFNVEAVGTPSLSYQWYSNSVASYSGSAAVTDGNDYSGSTTTNLTVTNNLLDYYYAVVQNSYGSVTSSIVQINPNPTIVGQASAVNLGNTDVVFSAVASGFPPLGYQWYYNTVSNYSAATGTTDGSGYTGSTSNTLNATINLADYYFLIVTNSFGSVTSSIAFYNPLPTVSQPSVFGGGGAPVGFSVSASGWPTLDYQWYVNTVSNYSGATGLTDGGGVSGSQTPSVTVNNLTAYYYVVVSNNYGAVTSEVVEVASPLTVTSAGEPIWNTVSQTNVIVKFSDSLDSVSSTALGNYSLSGATIYSAALAGSNEVVLTTSPLTPNSSYTLTVQNVNDYYGITMSPSSANLALGIYPANMALWVRANTNVTTDPGATTVNEWDDMSGNGNDFYSFAPNEPQLATNASGDPMIQFAATNLTQMLAGSDASLAITGDMSIVAVASFTTYNGATNGEIVSKTGSGSAASLAAPYDFYVVGNVAANGARLYRGNGTNYGQFTATSLPYIGSPHVLVVSESGNMENYFLDGAASGSGILNNSFNESSCVDKGQDVYIGARADGVNRLAGGLSELMIVPYALSTYDATELSSYLIQEHKIVTINPTPANITSFISNGNLMLSWPTDHTGWRLQTQTNSLSTGLGTNWVDYDGGETSTDQVTIPINSTNGAVFYRLIYNNP